MARAVVMFRQIHKIESIEIDSCLEETHTLTNTVTDHPVEEGFNITDHCRPNPDTVSLRCFVSNTPLSQEQVARAVRQGDVDFTTSAAQAVDIGAQDGRGANTYTKLKKLRDEGRLIQVVTPLRTYGVSSTEGMVIEGITIPRTRFNFDGLEFSINLKQVRIVRNRSTLDVRPRDKRTQKKKKEGNKTATQEPPARKKTALKNIADFARGR